jgi:outer membrane lipoprotein-sorting protein
MTQTRPGLTFVVSLFVATCCGVFFASATPFLLAQDESKKTDSPVDADKTVDSANQLIAEARQKLAEYESVKADLVQSVAIGGSRFRATGKYLQGSGGRIRLEYRLESPGQKSLTDTGQTSKTQTGESKSGASQMATNSMLQVSDGEVMYTLMKIGEDVRVTRVNVKEVQRSVADLPQSASSNWLRDIGLGGIKAMLSSFEKTMRFSDRITEKLNDQEFVRVSGTWKSEQRRQMVGAGAPADAPLPGYIPDYVRLYFTEDNAFLRRVEYLKRHPTENVIRPMVTLDFINVEINGPVESGAFSPKNLPDNVTPVDGTDALIQQLTQAAKPPGGQPAGVSKSAKP